MHSVSSAALAPAIETDRSSFRPTEENFGSIVTDIARLLFPKPNTAAKIAAELDCSVRNVELCLAGRQSWSGDAIALFVGEVLRRHQMRNVRVVARK